MPTLKTREMKIVPLSVGRGAMPRPRTMRNVVSATTYTGARAFPSAILPAKTSPKNSTTSKRTAGAGNKLTSK